MGGPKPQDYKARVGGPGKMAKRTDLQGNQPVRLPSGMAYGERKQLAAQQAAVPVPQNQAPPGGAGMPAAGPAEQAPQGRDLMALLGGAPTANPDQHFADFKPAPQQPDFRVQTTQELVYELEQIMQNSPVVPQRVLDLYEGLRMEARMPPGTMLGYKDKSVYRAK